MNFAAYADIWRLPAVRQAVLLGALGKAPWFGAGVVLTLHVVGALGQVPQKTSQDHGGQACGQGPGHAQVAGVPPQAGSRMPGQEGSGEIRRSVGRAIVHQEDHLEERGSSLEDRGQGAGLVVEGDQQNPSGHERPFDPSPGLPVL